MQNEQSLVERARQRDEAAFSELYEEHFDKIYRYITLKIGDRMEAEDITQQVFLNALRSIASFKWRGISFSAWLFRIAHNQVVDYFRKKSKRPSVPLENARVVAGDDPEMVAERKLDLEDLIRASHELTDLQREVISLRFAGDLRIAEVARIMGKNEGAIKALQHSAITALRKKLKATSDENK